MKINDLLLILSIISLVANIQGSKLSLLQITDGGTDGTTDGIATVTTDLPDDTDSDFTISTTEMDFTITEDADVGFTITDAVDSTLDEPLIVDTITTLVDDDLDGAGVTITTDEPTVDEVDASTTEDPDDAADDAPISTAGTTITTDILDLDGEDFTVSSDDAVTVTSDEDTIITTDEDFTINTDEDFTVFTTDEDFTIMTDQGFTVSSDDAVTVTADSEDLPLDLITISTDLVDSSITTLDVVVTTEDESFTLTTDIDTTSDETTLDVVVTIEDQIDIPLDDTTLDVVVTIEDDTFTTGEDTIGTTDSMDDSMDEPQIEPPLVPPPILVPGAKGDPHINGFLGQKFDFHGISGHVFNVLSDSQVQINALVVDADLAPNFKEKTYFGSFAMKFGRDRLYIGCNRRNGNENDDYEGHTIELNGVPIGNGLRRKYELDTFTLRMNEGRYRIQIEHEVYSFIVQFSSSARSSCHLNLKSQYREEESSHFNFERMKNIEHQCPHGVLGQTTRKTPNMTSKGRNGEGVIQGNYKSYMTHNLWSDEFEYNCFLPVYN